MIKYFRLLWLTPGLFVFLGCRKNDLRFKDRAQRCSIQKMTGTLGEQVLHRKFYYDEFGNPIAVVYLETEGATGTPTFNFYYNDKHQLVRYSGYSGHSLSYNSIGQVIIDSANYYYTGGDARYEHKFYYDFYGRISKVVSKFYYDVYESEGVGTISTGYYKYDARGNLIIPGVTYDHKTNLSRTHPIWQFINRDYSINNAVKATSYNSAGLPLTFEEDNRFLESSIFVQTIEYDCSTGKR